MKRLLSYIMVCFIALSLSVSYAHASPSKENTGVSSAENATVSQIKDNDEGDVETSIALNKALSGNTNENALKETVKELSMKVVYTGTTKTFNLSGLSVLDQVATINFSDSKVSNGKMTVELTPSAQISGLSNVSVMFFNKTTNQWEVITGDDVTVNEDGTITVNFPEEITGSTQFVILHSSNDGQTSGEEGTDTTVTPIEDTDDSTSKTDESTSTTKKSTKSKTGDDTPVTIYAGAGLVALVAVGALVYRSKKHN